MDKNIAIEFENVGKQYRLGLVGTGSLQHDINRWWQTSILGKEDPYLKIGEVNDRSKKGHSDYVWALKDISFKVEQGDVVGIIGKNGAGKSTLLKLLSHITAPSTGHITYRGRIASLLEVGTGFHPEMTARDNIYMNGSIMGMGKHEIDRKLDEIVDFAGIERYIDTPVKRFSSGMTVRLGFAVAAFLEPEILVVDEVLAVGDAEFQKKAIGKMQEVSQGGGRTVLFVSHNMDAVLNLCRKGIMLENGQLSLQGDVKHVVSEYLTGGNNKHVFTQNNSDNDVYISQISYYGDSQQEKGMFSFDQNIKISITYKKKQGVQIDDKLVGSIGIFNHRRINLCNVELPLKRLVNQEAITFHLSYPSSIIVPGFYQIIASAHIPNVQMYDKVEACTFNIYDNGTEYLKYGAEVDNGLVLLKPQITFS